MAGIVGTRQSIPAQRPLVNKGQGAIKERKTVALIQNRKALPVRLGYRQANFDDQREASTATRGHG